MDHMVSKKLRVELNLTNDLIRDIASLADNKISNNNARQTLLITFLDIIFEHTHSITLLINKNLVGSGFALVRPAHETLLRALWVMRYAKDKDIDKILKGKNPYPSTKSLSEKLDNFFTKTDFFNLLHQEWWSSLCDYTHTGILQMSRRWSSNGLLSSSYSDDEIIEILFHVQKILLVFSFVVFKFFELEDEMNTIIQFSEQYKKRTNNTY